MNSTAPGSGLSWDHSEKPKDVYRLAAMEIWGGNGPVDERVGSAGLDAHLLCRPYKGEREGGDLYFFSTCAAGQISRFTVADVSGHGPKVSDFALRLRGLIRRHINTPNPTKFTRVLNDEVGAMTREGLFATAVVTTYFAPTDHLIVCNAGHPRPLLYRAGEGRWDLLHHETKGVVTPRQARGAGVGNLPLGIIDGTAYPQFATPLRPGDIFVTYTDALIEASDEGGRQLGEQGLLDLVRGLDAGRPRDLRDGILRGVESHRGGRAADDDETLLVVHHNGSDPPPMPLPVRLKTLAKLIVGG